MNTTTTTKILKSSGMLMAAALCATTAPAQTNTIPTIEPSAEEFSRAGLWEVYAVGHASQIFNVFDSDVAIVGGGIGVGYNLSQHFTLNGEFDISHAHWNYVAFVFPAGEADTQLYMGHISIDYNILKSRVTPVLSLSFGFGAFDNGTGMAFEQNLGFGVRWDISRRVAAKLLGYVGAFETTHSRFLDVIQDQGDAWASIGVSLGVAYKF